MKQIRNGGSGQDVVNIVFTGSTDALGIISPLANFVVGIDILIS